MSALGCVAGESNWVSDCSATGGRVIEAKSISLVVVIRCDGLLTISENYNKQSQKELSDSMIYSELPTKP